MQKSFFYPVFLLFFTIVIHAQIPTDGLLRYYPFTGNAADYTPSAQHGTVAGATLTTDRFGHPNAAYSFDGISDYIQIPPVDLALTQYSYSVWAELEQVPFSGSQYMVLDIGSGGGGEQYINVNNQYLGTYNGWGNGSYNSNGSQYFYLLNGDAAAHQWVHLVSVRSANALKFYFNGILAGIDSSAAPTLPSYGSNFTAGFIGIRHNFTVPFKGKIDDIRIYDRPISAQEVEALYKEGLCLQSISVTDTLIINTNITGYNPLTYENAIKIFPNPTHDHIFIDCGSNYASLNGYSIKITNSLGQQVYQTAINQQQLEVNLATWSGNGTYFIYLIDAQSNIIDVRKIILQ